MKWCKKIVEEASSWELEGLIDILQRMLIIDARDRCSAATCLPDASWLLTTSEDRSATLTPTSHAARSGPAMAYVDLDGQGEEEQETLRIFASEGGRGTSLHELSLTDFFFSNTLLNMTTMFLGTSLLLVLNSSALPRTRIWTSTQTRPGET